MHRRTFLSGAVAVLGAAAGCVSGGGDGTDTPEPSPTTAPPTAITGRSFDHTGQCDDPGSATVSVLKRDPPSIAVEGCIVGKNGCTVPVLSAATYDADADELRVVVGTKEERTEGEVCTQALVNLQYRCVVDLEGDAPGTTVVVHDGAEGRREVARTQTG